MQYFTSESFLESYGGVELTRVTKEALYEALRDIAGGIMAYRIWLYQAWLDIKIRYRRSTLGPFWITINLAIMVLTIGILYSKILRINYRVFVPYFASGIVTWNLLSSLLLEATNAFVATQHLIKQMNTPLSLHVMRCLTRNVIVYLHSLVPLMAFNLLYLGEITWRLLLLPPFIVLLVAVFFFLMLIVAVVSTRFRDVTPIITSLIQILFFFTPIFWMRSLVPAGSEYLFMFNPFYHYIELLRNPLLGQPIQYVNVLFTLGSLVVAAAVSTVFYARYRKRVPYWL